MKKLLLILVLLSLPAVAFAGPVIEFSGTVHDFGDVRQGVQVSHDFEYRNAGDKTLVIEAIEPS